MPEKLYYKMRRVVPIKRDKQVDVIESVVWVAASSFIVTGDSIKTLESLMPGWECRGYNLRNLEEV